MKQQLEVVTVHNPRYKVSVIKNDEYIGRAIANGREWDGWMRKDIREHYVPGTEILDIGANIGYNTLMFSDYGPVHAFEPIFHPLVTQNCEQNDLQHQVTVHGIALSNVAHEAKMYFPHATPDGLVNFGGSSMIPDEHDSEFPITVQCKTLDEVYHGTPSVVKIDVEGHEMEVLRGAVGVLEKHKPAILIEIIHDDGEIKKFLKNIGYTREPTERPEKMFVFTQ